MNEVFINDDGTSIIFTEDSFRFEKNDYVQYFPYMDLKEIKMAFRNCLEVREYKIYGYLPRTTLIKYKKADKARMKEAVAYANIQIAKLKDPSRIFDSLGMVCSYDKNLTNQEICDLNNLNYHKKIKFLLLCKEGKWEFPCDEFYDSCIQKGVKEVDSSFYFQKALIIARNIIASKEVPIEYHEMYLTEKQIKLYFSIGKENAEIKRNEWISTPHQAKPNETQRRNIELAQKLASAYGLQKRKTMLSDSLESVNEEIKKKQEGEDALRQLSFILASSAKEEKPKDWAILGGIANGIAGAGAGIAVALDAMEENKRIEARNQRNREAVMNLSADIYSSSFEVSTSIGQLRTARDMLSNEIKKTDEKVVLDDVKGSVLYNALELCSVEIFKTKNNILEVELTLNNSFVPDVPEGVHIVIDGVLSADIFANNIKVGSVYIPLPLYGIECGKKETVVGYCKYYMPEEQSYSFKINKYNLWAMEQ